MRHLMALVAILLLAATPALGGSALFTEVVNHVEAGTVVQFEISVETDALGNLDDVELAIGWDLADNDLTFTYSPQFRAAMDAYLEEPPLYDCYAFYDNEVYVHGKAVTGIGNTNIMVGTLMVDTTGLEEGFYDIAIDNAVDQELSALRYQEDVDLVGCAVGTVHIIPEPPSFIMLLGLGVAVVLRRVAGRDTGSA
ncbi:MAG: hypothetical protein KAV82_08050 [Phycisphaerae bacterium]|nr:hypothetical protein [Phycisphaerae bacterium]